MFAPNPQTTELWGEAKAMDDPPLCPSEKMENLVSHGVSQPPWVSLEGKLKTIEGTGALG